MSLEDREHVESEQGMDPGLRSEIVPYHSWMALFRDLSSSLIQTIERKEVDFLEIGRSIKGISSLSREMAQSVAELVHKASGQGFRGEVDKFSREFQELFEVCDAVDPMKGGGLLRSIAQSIDDLQDKMKGFRQIIKRLRVLAISTRIESSRLGSEGHGFSTLADDVEQLATKTAEYSKQVQDKTKVLDSMVNDARRKTATVSALDSEQSDQVLKDVQRSFENLQGVQAEAEDISSVLSESSERIASNVGEVVSSVQFHDIVRQQIEHISLVLEECRSMMAEHVEQSEPGEQDEEIISWTADVCRLQSYQSEATQKEFVQALDQIWTSLEHISSDVLELDRYVHSTSLCRQGQHFLAELEERIMRFLEPLKQGCGFLEEVMKAMGTMAETVAEMGTFISQVEEVGEEIELIALNASIKAAHTGDRGLALGVLAEAIRKLSVESGDKVAEVSKALRTINEQADQLHQDAEKTREASKKEEHLSSSLNGIVQSLRQANMEIESSLNGVQDAGQVLSRSIEDLISHRNVEYEVVSELTRARDELSDVEAQARELVPEFESPERSDRLQTLLNRYTMESERLVHMAFSGLRPDEQDQEILFDQVHDNQESEFGENVELF